MNDHRWNDGMKNLGSWVKKSCTLHLLYCDGRCTSTRAIILHLGRRFSVSEWKKKSASKIQLNVLVLPPPKCDSRLARDSKIERQAHIIDLLFLPLSQTQQNFLAFTPSFFFSFFFFFSFHNSQFNAWLV
jgi:hypothetical protein